MRRRRPSPRRRRRASTPPTPPDRRQAPPAGEHVGSQQRRPSSGVASPSRCRRIVVAVGVERRPGQRRRPGVADSRAISACIGVPPTSTIAPRARKCGSAAMSAMSITGPAAACGGGEHRPSPRRPCVPRTTRPSPPRARRGARIRPANVAKRSSSATSEQRQHPRRHGVAARRHGDPAAVGAAVGAPRHGVGEAGAEPRLLLAGERVQRTAAAPSAGTSSPAG